MPHFPFLRRTALALALLLAAGSNAAVAQSATSPSPEQALSQLVLEHWNEDVGLPQSSVRALAQTADGYLWLGTQEGLVRYNGAGFETFDKRNTDAFVGGHSIRTLLSDGDRLFVGTNGSGLLYFDVDGLDVHPWAGQLSGASISALWRSPDGSIWVGTFGDGLFVLDGTGLRRIGEEDGLPSNYVKAILGESASRVWVGTKEGLAEISPAGLNVHDTASGLPSAEIESVHIDARGILRVATREGLALHIGERFRPDHAFGDTWIVSQMTDERGALWIGTAENGLYRVFYNQIEHLNTGDGLDSGNIPALLQDREGSIWIGTDGGGLNRLRAGKFDTFGPAEGLASHMAYAVWEAPDGKIWVGSDNSGITILGGASPEYLSVDEGLSHNNISSITGSVDGSVWVGTFGGGLNRIQNGVITQYSVEDGLGHEMVSGIHAVSNGDLLISTDGGLTHFDGENFRTWSIEDGLPTNFVMTALKDRDGAIWIGTYDAGVVKMKDGVLMTISRDQGLRAEMVLALHEDRQGRIWAGTYDGGLALIEDDKAVSFTMRDGLHDDRIYSILEDRSGYLWMTCNNGIFKVQIEELLAYRGERISRIGYDLFSKADGLRTNEFNGGFQPASARTADGRFIFPSIQGIAIIDPDDIRLDEFAPPVKIEHVWVNGEAWPPAESITLPPGTDKVSFDFAALSFVAPSRVRYRVMLEGFDREWQTTAQNQAVYTNLPAGGYVFRVQAANHDGVWNEVGAVINIERIATIYESWWFYAIILLTLGGSFVALHRLRIHRLQSRQFELERIVKERTTDLEESQLELSDLNSTLERRVREQLDLLMAERRKYVTQLTSERDRALEADRLKTAILNNLNHEFRTPLTAILGYTELVRPGVDTDRSEFLDSIADSGHRLLDTLNSLLDLAELQSGSRPLDLREIDLRTVITNVRTEMAEEFESSGLEVIDRSSEQALPAVVDGLGAHRAIQAVLDNALKFTDEGGVTVDAELTDEFSTLTIRDTGIGIPEEHRESVFEPFRQVSDGLARSHNGAGVGLTVVRLVMAQMGGSVDIVPLEGGGTEVRLAFPRSAPIDREPVQHARHRTTSSIAAPTEDHPESA